MYEELKETIYIEQPRGYKDGTERMCRLQKSFCILKQASRYWNKELTDFLFKLGFIEGKADPCLFILITNDMQDLETFFQKLRAEFKAAAAAADHFLVLQIKSNEGCSIIIHQHACTKYFESF